MLAVAGGVDVTATSPADRGAGGWAAVGLAAVGLPSSATDGLLGSATPRPGRLLGSAPPAPGRFTTRPDGPPPPRPHPLPQPPATGPGSAGGPGQAASWLLAILAGLLLVPPLGTRGRPPAGRTSGHWLTYRPVVAPG